MTPVRANGIVTLLTDFGERDTYVGQMKGVLLGIDPSLTLVDLTHQVPAQDVVEGGFQLATGWNAFPPGTVHLAVVDPGVGTPRRPIAFAFHEHLFVLPDNGLGSLLVRGETPDELVVLDRRDVWRGSVSPTFHGRDLFAPIAGRLARGDALDSVGTPADPASLVDLQLGQVVRSGQMVQGPIVSVDHFGNCRTLIRPEDLPGQVNTVQIRCGQANIRGISRTFGEVPEGKTLALFGSHGGLEIAVRDGNAARAWELQRGMLVEIVVRA